MLCVLAVGVRPSCGEMAMDRLWERAVKRDHSRKFVSNSRERRRKIANLLLRRYFKMLRRCVPRVGISSLSGPSGQEALVGLRIDLVHTAMQGAAMLFGSGVRTVKGEGERPSGRVRVFRSTPQVQR